MGKAASLGTIDDFAESVNGEERWNETAERISTSESIGEGAYQVGEVLLTGGASLSKHLAKEGIELGIETGAKNLIKTSVDDAVEATLRNTPDQDALIQLAKEAKKLGGASSQEAATLRQWASEYSVFPNRGPEVHPGRPFGQIPHLHIGPVNHIPVKPN